MLPIRSLADGPLSAAVEYLAARSVELADRPPTYAEKAAAGDFLASLGNAAAANPVLSKALLGGGIGAAMGAGSHALGGDERDPSARRRGVLGSAVSGGLAGAAVGGGLGAVQKFWPGNLGGGLGGGQAGGQGTSGGPGAGPRPKPGEFTHEGQKYRINPQVLADHPELVKRVSDLSEPSSLARRAAGGAIGAYWDNDYAPTSAKLLPGVATMDFLANNERTQLGNRNLLKWPAAGLDRLGMSGAAGKVRGLGERLRFGMIDPQTSTNPTHLEQGLAAVRKDPKGLGGLFDDQHAAVKALHENPAEIAARGRAERPTPFTHKQTRTVPQYEMQMGHDVDPQTGVATPVGQRSTFMGNKTEKIHETLEPHHQGRLKAIGAGTEAEAFGKDKSLTDPSSRARIRRGVFSGDVAKPTHPLAGMRLAKRVGLYAGLPAAEFALRSRLDDQARSTDLRRLMDQYAEKVPQ